MKPPQFYRLVLSSGCLALSLASACAVRFPEDALHTEAGAAHHLTGDASSGRDAAAAAVDQAPAGDAGQCHESCVNNCKDGLCKLRCNEGCTCPPGHYCQIQCDRGQCTGAIDCTQAAGCNIECDSRACKKEIACGSGPCDISCHWGACRETIDCRDASTCCVRCSFGACENVRCPDSCRRCKVSIFQRECSCSGSPD